MPSASSSLRVWVTRAVASAEATAARVRELGHDPFILPLIETRELLFEPPDLTDVAAIAFTSAAGVRAFAGRVVGRDHPILAVGDATAAAARAAGWDRVTSADGDGRALSRRILADPPAGPVLIATAAAPAFDLAGALATARVPVRVLAVYATTPLRPPAETLAALAAGRIDAVLLHAPSAARALDAAVPGGAPNVIAACLSPACTPRTPGWRIAVAARPREDALLQLLARPAGSTLDSPSPRQ